jgi:hypothetical protein
MVLKLWEEHASFSFVCSGLMCCVAHISSSLKLGVIFVKVWWLLLFINCQSAPHCLGKSSSSHCFFQSSLLVHILVHQVFTFAKFIKYLQVHYVQVFEFRSFWIFSKPSDLLPLQS